MMGTAAVIDLFSGRPWTGSEVPSSNHKPQPLECVAETVQNSFAALRDVNENQVSKTLDFRPFVGQMLESSGIGEFLLIARDKESGYFFHSLHLPQDVTGHDLFALIGLLENLKLELCERSAMAPSIDVDGRIIDAYKET